MWIIDQFKALFNKFISICKEFIAAALPLAKQILVGQLSDFANKAVSELNVATITNEERRKQAFDKIKAYAIENGITARDSLINLLIELAVQKLKN